MNMQSRRRASVDRMASVVVAVFCFAISVAASALAQTGAADPPPNGLATNDERTSAGARSAAASEANLRRVMDVSGDSTAAHRNTASSSAGPDILTGDFIGVIRFGTVGGITAYAVGTNACNVGDQPVSWLAHTNEHPVWFGNMYRLMDGRFEQIGMSWVTHGFYALSQAFCGPCSDGIDGQELSAGCSTPESPAINGAQIYLGPRSDVNAHTGYFPFPWTAPAYETVIDRRLQVHDEDLDPALNPSAIYFVEGQYISSDDALAENGNNNASYRRVEVQEPFPGVFDVRTISNEGTVRGEPAIRAWQEQDPDVYVTEIQVPGDGLFILAAKATDLDNGFWHYEYALQNLNSHRAAGSFSLCFAGGTVVKNVGFHDVDYHSGEVYDSTDWIDNVAEGGAKTGVNWSTQSYDANPNANALRFGTIYNFRFDTNAPPEWAGATIGLFRPGDPQKVWGHTIGPPDYCPNPLDADHDGQSDCSDYCPDTPPNVCTCQGSGLCCIGCTGPCWLAPRDECVESHGTPDACGDPQCKNGCPLLDMDNNGDRDLADIAGLQRCFSGLPGDPGYVVPTTECLNRLDIDDDHAINLFDYQKLFELGLLGQQ